MSYRLPQVLTGGPRHITSTVGDAVGEFNEQRSERLAPLALGVIPNHAALGPSDAANHVS